VISLLRRLLAAAFVLPLILLAGCGDSASPSAATVNGEDISEADFDAELQAILDNDQYVELIEQADVKVKGDGDGTLDNAFVAQVLTRFIAFELIRQEIDERELEVGDGDRDDARQSVSEQVGGEEVFDAFPPSYQDLLTERTAEVAVLERDLAEASTDPEAYYEENQDLFEQACAHHILLETVEAATDVIARLEGGASFEEIASAESVDTGSGAQGGDLGCAPRGVYVPEFEEAVFEGPIGEVQPPVESQFGFHVIRVDERNLPPFEEVQADVEQRLSEQGQEAFNTFISEAFAEAEVEVSPRYGTWSTGGPQPGVVPPDVPTTVASGGDETDDGIDDLIEPPSVGG
jgi:parvulin-like peptidyl-prolyl isomerase